MNTKKTYDKTYLKGDYLLGFQEICKHLKSDFIPSNFKNEVEGDLLEIFIRNQNNGKDFNEVIGGNINTFIKDITDSYVLTTSKKYIFLNAFKNSLTISSVVAAFAFIQHGANLGSLTLAMISILVGLLIHFILYKICGKYNSNTTSYVTLCGAFGFIIFEKIFFNYISFFKTLSTYSINYMIYFSIIAILACIILALNTYLKNRN